MQNKIIKTVQSLVLPLKTIFSEKFDVDFYQREYVWQRKQLEDLITDLSLEFLKEWDPDHPIDKVQTYDPYFMGEIVLSTQEEKCNSIIDGQQRITTFTLLLIYLLRTFSHLDKFPASDIEKLIYSNHYGSYRFNLDIPERKECMSSLYEDGNYVLKDSDTISVRNIVDRYNDIADCWNEHINDKNAVHFAYWIIEKVVFSKVWTNSDEFAYVIFETMNDRGLSLTQVEMLRSYLLANISTDSRDVAVNQFDSIVRKLVNVKLASKSKAEFEFFKIYFRSHLAESMSQKPESQSDFVRIGKEFHRWIRDNNEVLGLKESQDYIDFISKLSYFSDIYVKINTSIEKRDTKNYLYLVVNSDYNFTLQPALILASIKYGDSEEIVEKKIQLVTKYITKVLSWRVWNHWAISQSALESQVYDTCKEMRGMDLIALENYLASDPIELPKLNNSPTLNQSNRRKLRTLLALITEIVARESGESDYLLNQPSIEVEHIWADHFTEHKFEFDNEADFSNVRNNIGDLLLLPKSFNASYNDEPYEVKVVHYIEQNILAQTLNSKKYENNPGFLKFKSESKLDFKSYESFKRNDVGERAELYKSILLWNWNLYKPKESGSNQ